MGRAARLWGREGGGDRSAVFAIFCAFVLALAQTLIVAHASSHDATAPGHDTKTCVYHVNGDRPAPALTPETPALIEPISCAIDIDAPAGTVAAAAAAASIWPRGPPL